LIVLRYVNNERTAIGIKTKWWALAIGLRDLLSRLGVQRPDALTSRLCRSPACAPKGLFSRVLVRAGCDAHPLPRKSSSMTAIADSMNMDAMRANAQPLDINLDSKKTGSILGEACDTHCLAVRILQRAEAYSTPLLAAEAVATTMVDKDNAVRTLIILLNIACINHPLNGYTVKSFFRFVDVNLIGHSFHARHCQAQSIARAFRIIRPEPSKLYFHGSGRYARRFMIVSLSLSHYEFAAPSE